MAGLSPSGTRSVFRVGTVRILLTCISRSVASASCNSMEVRFKLVVRQEAQEELEAKPARTTAHLEECKLSTTASSGVVAALPRVFFSTAISDKFVLTRLNHS